MAGTSTSSLASASIGLTTARLAASLAANNSARLACAACSAERSKSATHFLKSVGLAATIFAAAGSNGLACD